MSLLITLHIDIIFNSHYFQIHCHTLLLAFIQLSTDSFLFTIFFSFNDFSFLLISGFLLLLSTAFSRISPLSDSQAFSFAALAAARCQAFFRHYAIDIGFQFLRYITLLFTLLFIIFTPHCFRH
jgi:hypothetical protein